MRAKPRSTDAWEAWAFSGPSGGDDAGRRDHGRPTTTPVAISLAPTTRLSREASPPGLVRSPFARRPIESLCEAHPKRKRILGFSTAVLGLSGIAMGPPFLFASQSWAGVALMPQWRQNHPNNRPPTRATAISGVGQLRPLALQKKSGSRPDTQPRPR
jgi:hypothetical protein